MEYVIVDFHRPDPLQQLSTNSGAAGDGSDFVEQQQTMEIVDELNADVFENVIQHDSGLGSEIENGEDSFFCQRTPDGEDEEQTQDCHRGQELEEDTFGCQFADDNDRILLEGREICQQLQIQSELLAAAAEVSNSEPTLKHSSQSPLSTGNI